MTYKFSILERIDLISILPEGNRLLNGISDGIQDKLQLTKDEEKEIGFRLDKQNNFRWDKDIEKEIDLDSTEEMAIRNELIKLEESGGLLRKYSSLYDKLKEVTT